jgi:hypothetical protein
VLACWLGRFAPRGTDENQVAREDTMKDNPPIPHRSSPAGRAVRGYLRQREPREYISAHSEAGEIEGFFQISPTVRAAWRNPPRRVRLHHPPRTKI